MANLFNKEGIVIVKKFNRKFGAKKPENYTESSDLLDRMDDFCMDCTNSKPSVCDRCKIGALVDNTLSNPYMLPSRSWAEHDRL